MNYTLYLQLILLLNFGHEIDSMMSLPITFQSNHLEREHVRFSFLFAIDFFFLFKLH